MSRVKVLKMHKEAKVPEYMSTGAAGCDVCAVLDQDLDVGPLERVAVPTGLAFEIPPGYEIQVRPRSGLSLKQGLTVVNAPGTIDSDYRGEVKILLINLSREVQTITSGQRIAQLILSRVDMADWVEAETLNTTQREAGGFGSTGV